MKYAQLGVRDGGGDCHFQQENRLQRGVGKKDKKERR